MDASPQIQVTLSGELLNHLRREAETRHVPLRWLVAGLVCDTLEREPATAKPGPACWPRPDPGPARSFCDSRDAQCGQPARSQVIHSPGRHLQHEFAKRQGGSTPITSAPFACRHFGSSR